MTPATKPKIDTRSRIPASSVIGSASIRVALGVGLDGGQLGVAAVTVVEGRPLGVDLGQVVEVVRGRRAAGHPLQAVALPGVVPGRLAPPDRDEEVPDED